MSETLDIVEQETERAERPVLVRYAPLSGVEGRTIDALIVPYGVAAEVSDDKGATFYREEWMPGAFDDQIVAGHRLKVLMNFEHHRGIQNVVGKGISLRSESDGLHGSFEILPTSAGDTALELVHADILDGISLEAYAKRTIRMANGVVRRVKAHLDGAALCRNPAFKDARVLAVRGEEIEEEFVLDAALMPVEIDPGLIERCRSLGIRMPQRYQEAHPVETDTPSDGEGTSADGTRPETTS